MKIQIVYASLTGCTRRVASAIYNQLPTQEKSIHNLVDGIPVLDGDIILFGYWGTGGAPCQEMQSLLRSVKDKAVGIFCTLGYYADSAHARETLESGIHLVKDRNQVIGGYVCNGAVARNLQEAQGLGGEHIPTQQKELRWEMTAGHPTKAECDLAAERFRERITLYCRCRELGIPFQSIL